MLVNGLVYKEVQYFVDDIASGVWELKPEHWKIVSKNAHAELDKLYGHDEVENCLLAYQS